MFNTGSISNNPFQRILGIFLFHFVIIDIKPGELPIFMLFSIVKKKSAGYVQKRNKIYLRFQLEQG